MAHLSLLVLHSGGREPIVASMPVTTVSVLGVLLEAEVQEEDVATSLQVGSVTSPTTVAGCVPGSWCAWRRWPMVVALAVTHGEVVLETSIYRVLFRQKSELVMPGCALESEVLVYLRLCITRYGSMSRFGFDCQTDV